MEKPTSVSPGSIMPEYPWLLSDHLDVSQTSAKISAMRKLGVPYPDGYEKQAVTDLQTQADAIVKRLEDSRIITDPDKEIIALIAYLQRLGTDIKSEMRGGL
jgi:cytochrome c oxidase cbb3-type subunit I/II